MKKSYKFTGKPYWAAKGIYRVEEGHKPYLCTWTNKDTGEVIQQVRVYKDSLSPLQIQQHLVRRGRTHWFRGCENFTVHFEVATLVE